MNSDQFVKTIIMPLLAAIGGWAVGSGKLTVDQWGSVMNFMTQYGIGIIMTGGAAFFAWWKSRAASKVLDAKAIPGVSVSVNPGLAPQPVIDLAKDPAVTKVNVGTST